MGDGLGQNGWRSVESQNPTYEDVLTHNWRTDFPAKPKGLQVSQGPDPYNARTHIPAKQQVNIKPTPVRMRLTRQIRC